MKLVTMILAALAHAPGADETPHRYAGAEAHAIHCAATITMSAHVLHDADQISAEMYDEASRAAARILSHHVTGSREQRMAGYDRAMRRLATDDAVGAVHSGAALAVIEDCAATFLQ